MSAADFVRRLWAPPDAEAITDLQSWVRQFTVLLSKFP